VVGFNSHLVHVKLLDGEPLSEGPFIVRLTSDEMGMIAWALMRYSMSQELPRDDGSARKLFSDLSYQFADIVGIH
jgi:hypothetical protein